jgi:hypothetical protein
MGGEEVQLHSYVTPLTATRRSFTARLLYPWGTNPQYPLDSRRMGKCQSWSICCGEEKNLGPLPGIEPQMVQPVAK